MPNLGFPEILMIMVIALVVFGPRKLPELGQSLGRALREFRQHTQQVTGEFQRDLNEPAPVAAPVATASVAAAPVSSTPSSAQSE
ncbi:twin-arginine translocase TatA/TatE family subunit [Deinococcus cavernae]|uniref:Sec-independent protein translocase protein TatA n=1 Tax=Deinococcus cavernae TaxID=2320857 RepID=A0A418VGR7_9DEIO|nr:twin-arginine translocase TatA/TatE family subunit [Deinococcus cavernae]RJF75237.1 twin-arginine translocase TatA/TatE family subunit [Deinococcus cavernae]